jgi:predicted nucleic acid-binding Zn ribbon protein
MEQRKCEVCGKEFTAIRNTKVCCSDKCSQKRWKILKGIDFKSETRKCIVCGAEFETKSTRQICCSKECSKNRNRTINKELEKKKYHEKVQKKRIEEAMPKSNHDKIANIAIEARSHGMTYGQYVAKMGLK